MFNYSYGSFENLVDKTVHDISPPYKAPFYPSEESAGLIVTFDNESFHTNIIRPNLTVSQIHALNSVNVCLVETAEELVELVRSMPNSVKVLGVYGMTTRDVKSVNFCCYLLHKLSSRLTVNIFDFARPSDPRLEYVLHKWGRTS